MVNVFNDQTVGLIICQDKCVTNVSVTIINIIKIGILSLYHMVWASNNKDH
jgi:hypothetical protein